MWRSTQQSHKAPLYAQGCIFVYFNQLAACVSETPSASYNIKAHKSRLAVKAVMSLPCIKPMQPFHRAVLSLSSHSPPSLISSPPPHSVLPLARTASSSSSTGSGFSASLTHNRRLASRSHCQDRLSRHLPLGPLWSSFQHQLHLFLVCFLVSARCTVADPVPALRLAGMPTDAHISWLGIYFGGDFVSAPTVNEWFNSCFHLRGLSPCLRASLRTFLCFCDKCFKWNDRRGFELGGCLDRRSSGWRTPRGSISLCNIDLCALGIFLERHCERVEVCSQFAVIFTGRVCPLQGLLRLSFLLRSEIRFHWRAGVWASRTSPNLRCPNSKDTVGSHFGHPAR